MLARSFHKQEKVRNRFRCLFILPLFLLCILARLKTKCIYSSLSKIGICKHCSSTAVGHSMHQSAKTWPLVITETSTLLWDSFRSSCDTSAPQGTVPVLTAQPQVNGMPLYETWTMFVSRLVPGKSRTADCNDLAYDFVRPNATRRKLSREAHMTRHQSKGYRPRLKTSGGGHEQHRVLSWPSQHHHRNAQGQSIAPCSHVSW